MPATLTELPLKATSAPASLLPSRVASRAGSRVQSPRPTRQARRAFSQPTSPRALRRSTSAFLRPGSAGAGATFGTEPRKIDSYIKETCSVHSYQKIPNFLDSTSNATKFSTAPRLLPDRRTLTAVHSYAALTSTLRASGATAFGQARRDDLRKESTPDHYVTPSSTLKTSGATAFGRAPRVDSTAGTAGAPVHAYTSQTSSFSLKECGTFAKAGREAASTAVLCKVHSYGDLTSTLSKSGFAGWGCKPVTKPVATPMKAAAVKMVAALRAQKATSEEVRPKSPSHVEDPLVEQLHVEEVDAA